MNRNLIAAFATASLISLALSGPALAHGDKHGAPDAAHPAPTPHEPSKAVAPANASVIEIAGHLAKLEVSGDDVTLTITEKNGAAPESAKDAKLIFQLGTEKKTVALQGKDGKFTGTAALGGATKYIAVLQVTLDGKSRSGRFNVTPATHDNAGAPENPH